MGEMIEYQERLVYQEEYRGYTIFLFLSNFNQYLMAALTEEELALASKLDAEMRSKRTASMDWYEMCSLKFFFGRDMKLIPNSIPVYSKPGLEVVIMGRGKETYSRIMASPKWDIDQKLRN